MYDKVATHHPYNARKATIARNGSYPKTLKSLALFHAERRPLPRRFVFRGEIITRLGDLLAPGWYGRVPVASPLPRPCDT